MLLPISIKPFLVPEIPLPLVVTAIQATGSYNSITASWYKSKYFVERS